MGFRLSQLPAQCLHSPEQNQGRRMERQSTSCFRLDLLVPLWRGAPVSDLSERLAFKGEAGPESLLVWRTAGRAIEPRNKARFEAWPVPGKARASLTCLLLRFTATEVCFLSVNVFVCLAIVHSVSFSRRISTEEPLVQTLKVLPL